MKPMLESGITLGEYVAERGGKEVCTGYYVENCDGEEFKISHEMYQLLLHADGRHSFKLDGVSSARMRRIQSEMVRCKIIRTSRFVRNGLINQFTLLPIGEGSKRTKHLLEPVNRLLPWFALLWFAIGVYATYCVAVNENWSSDFSIPIMVVLIVASILIHEGGHLIAAIAYGCKAREIGVLLLGVIPCGAYVETLGAPKGKREGVQLYLAGPESNVLLAGIYMLLANIISAYEITFVVAAAASFALGLANCIPAFGSDGHYALSSALGVDSLHDIAKKTLFNRTARRRLLAAGSAGVKCLCLLSGVLLSDILVVCLIGVDVVQIVQLIVSAWMW